MIDAFAAHLGVGAERIAMVGDSTHDLHAAKAAGAVRIAIGTGPASLDDLAPHADHCIETMAALPELIGRLAGR
jgi:phosphoglycolate phosphatase